MNRSPQRRGFLYFAGPLFLYWIIEFGAQMIGELFVMIRMQWKLSVRGRFSGMGVAGTNAGGYASDVYESSGDLYAVSGGDHDICGPLHNSADLVPVSERA